MISKTMPIEDIVREFPETRLIFERYGLRCAGCQAALFENVVQGAKVHGINVEDLINDLNKAVLKR
jgi:hybrid cluster-associated redox disulfide protein